MSFWGYQTLYGNNQKLLPSNSTSLWMSISWSKTTKNEFQLMNLFTSIIVCICKYCFPSAGCPACITILITNSFEIVVILEVVHQMNLRWLLQNQFEIWEEKFVQRIMLLIWLDNFSTYSVETCLNKMSEEFYKNYDQNSPKKSRWLRLCTTDQWTQNTISLMIVWNREKVHEILSQLSYFERQIYAI